MLGDSWSAVNGQTAFAASVAYSFLCDHPRRNFHRVPGARPAYGEGGQTIYGSKRRHRQYQVMVVGDSDSVASSMAPFRVASCRWGTLLLGPVSCL